MSLSKEKIQLYKKKAITKKIDKRYNKIELKRLSITDHLKIAEQWKIHHKSNDLINQIYNHRNNQPWFIVFQQEQHKKIETLRKRLDYLDINQFNIMLEEKCHSKSNSSNDNQPVVEKKSKMIQQEQHKKIETIKKRLKYLDINQFNIMLDEKCHSKSNLSDDVQPVVKKKSKTMHINTNESVMEFKYKSDKDIEFKRYEVNDSKCINKAKNNIIDEYQTDDEWRNPKKKQRLNSLDFKDTTLDSIDKLNDYDLNKISSELMSEIITIMLFLIRESVVLSDFKIHIKTLLKYRLCINRGYTDSQMNDVINHLKDSNYITNSIVNFEPIYKIYLKRKKKRKRKRSYTAINNSILKQSKVFDEKIKLPQNDYLRIECNECKHQFKFDYELGYHMYEHYPYGEEYNQAMESVMVKYYKSISDKKKYQKYNKSPKGRERLKKYKQSDKGRNTIKKYNQSDKHRNAFKKYKQSDKSSNRLKRYNQSDKGKNKYQQYNQSNKGKNRIQQFKQNKKQNILPRYPSLNTHNVNDTLIDIDTDNEIWCNQLWDADNIPSDNELSENAEKNVITAAYVFLLMNGIPEDSRNPPTNLIKDYDKQEILDKWKVALSPEDSIRICGPCGKRDIMTKDEYKILSPTDILLKCCIANKKTLPPKDSACYKAKHLIKLNNTIYHFAHEGVIHNKVIVCKTCYNSLEHSKKTRKPPRHTLAFYDLGRIPIEFPQLTYAEKISIKKAVVFVPAVQFKAIGGYRAQGIKGHVFAMKLTKEQISKTVQRHLPRHDLADLIQVVLYGKKTTWAVAKQIARKGPLNIRLPVVLQRLRWLKSIGNPYYQDIIIPETDIQIAKTRKILQNAIKKILDNSAASESGIINKLAEKTRSNVMDDKVNLDNNMQGSILRNVFIRTENVEEEPLMNILRQLKKKIADPMNKINKNRQTENENDEEIKSETKMEEEENTIEQDSFMPITIEDQLYNEYTENHKLLSYAFPETFPFGLTSEIMGTGTVPSQLQKNWLLFHDRRGAQNVNLVFLLYDQMLRHSRNKNVAFRINTAHHREAKFIKLCGDPTFEMKIAQAIKHPYSIAAKTLKSTINPLIKIIGRNIPWSTGERNDTLGKLYAMMHFFNTATHFITISPSMRQNNLAVQLACDGTDLLPIHIRSKLIAENPVIAARVFHRLIDKLFELILQLPLNHYNGKKTYIDRLLTRNRKKYVGPYGHVSAGYGITEEQSGGSLHLHALIFGGWDIDVFQQHIHIPEVAILIRDMIDSQITCHISDELIDDLKSNPKMPIFASEPYITNCEEIENAAERIAARTNHHKHSFTCWKKDAIHCRMAMPRAHAKTTYFTEIKMDEEKNIPVRKFHDSYEGHEIISDPPIRDVNGNPFINEDDRVIGYGLKRRNFTEQMQVEQQPLTTALFRCNSSIQPLLTPSQAIAAMYYIAEYMKKDPYKLQRILPLLLQASMAFKKYGSQAADPKSKERKAKNILQKLLNKTGLIEISDQQAASAVLGYDSYFSTHQFVFIYPWIAVQQHHKITKHLQHTPIDDSSNELLEIESEAESGKVIGISRYEMYFYRGKALRNLCYYVYSAIIGTIKLESKKSNTKGRGDNKRFLFTPNSNPSKCLIQKILSLLKIPRISGGAPPAYPGEQPGKDSKDIDLIASWNIKAKLFVEFYSLLFLPINEKGLPFEPTQPTIHILPWNTSTSWNNFWIIFGSWDIPINSTNIYSKLYKRSMWRIFKNMVDNLRQAPQTRSLITKWRFRAADKASSNTKTDSSENNTTGVDITDSIHELTAISEMIRTKHGVDEVLSRSQIEKKKANSFLEIQIKKLNQIHIPKVLNKNRTQHKCFTFKQCERLINKLNTSTKKNNNSNANDAPIIELTPKDSKILREQQLQTVKRLEIVKKENNNQLLAFVQGNPGSGKSTTAKELARTMGLRVHFTGTTNTAAGEIDGDTINSVLKLGRNKNNFTNTDIEPAHKQHIIDTLRDIDLIVIDEASMLTPITLARIDMRLRLCFGDEPFGGKDILLIGDMCQFPPVSPGLSYSALFQAVVRVGRQLRSPNDKYRLGAQLFMLFRLVKLKGQVRANKKYDEWLSKLRDFNVECPINDEWLSKLKILKTADLAPKNSIWPFTVNLCSGNMEVNAITKYKVHEFAKTYNEPILRWVCKVIKGSNTEYTELGWDPEGICGELIKWYAYGCPCEITKKINNINKGTKGIYVGVAWKDKNININDFKCGEVNNVPQPDYIIVEITTKDKKKQLIPIGLEVKPFKDKKQKFAKRYKDHNSETIFSRTYHKIQGSTADSIVLSLNARRNISKKIHPLTITSLYVGLSRVHGFNEHRVLPFSEEDAIYLKGLKHDPHLKPFFDNYDENGNWKPDGFKEWRENLIFKAKLKLGMILFDELIKEDCKPFVETFDLLLDDKKLATYKKVLKPFHEEGVHLLHANNNELLLQQQNILQQRLAKENIEKMTIKRLRYFAKRFGRATHIYKHDLINLVKEISKKRYKSILEIDTEITELDDEEQMDIDYSDDEQISTNNYDYM